MWDVYCWVSYREWWGMSVMPPRTIEEFLLHDPIGVIITCLLIIFITGLIVKFIAFYPTLAININLTHICIGGACPK
jgi:hypothetical protein